MDQLTFSQTIDGFLLACYARRLSPNTIRDYTFTFRRFQGFLKEDPPIAAITQRQVESFLASLPVSKKTVLNYHIGLSALWTWAVKESIAPEHIVHRVSRPKPEKKEIKPYSQTEIKDMLAALTHSNFYTRPGKRQSNHRLPNVERHRALIYLLLDTGIRASELVNLHIYDVDVRNHRITVMGKGSKERSIPFSARTGQMLWRYLTTRKNASASEYLFVTDQGRSLAICRLLKILVTIGNRASVPGVNVHRFRHTFAINFLRNGGDPYSLQMILGHSTLEMVKNYLALAQVDLDKSHKLASPVYNWRL